MEPLLPPDRRKACVFCRRTMGCSYFEIPLMETTSLCGCCALDETLMGRYAPLKMKNEQRYKVFINWVYENLSIMYPGHNIEFSMDEIQGNGSSKRPDTILHFSDPDYTRHVILHIECDGRPKNLVDCRNHDRAILQNNRRHLGDTLLSFVTLRLHNAVEAGMATAFDLYNHLLNLILVVLARQIEALDAGLAGLAGPVGLVYLNYGIGPYNLSGFRMAVWSAGDDEDNDLLAQLLRPWQQDIEEDASVFFDSGSLAEPRDCGSLAGPKKARKQGHNIYRFYFKVVAVLRVLEPDLPRMFLFWDRNDALIGRVRGDAPISDASFDDPLGTSRVDYLPASGSNPLVFGAPGRLQNRVIRNGVIPLSAFMALMPQRVKLLEVMRSSLAGTDDDLNQRRRPVESIEVLQYVEGGHGGNFILNTPPP
jgi:hypothetical protein